MTLGKVHVTWALACVSVCSDTKCGSQCCPENCSHHSLSILTNTFWTHQTWSCSDPCAALRSSADLEVPLPGVRVPDFLLDLANKGSRGRLEGRGQRRPESFLPLTLFQTSASQLPFPLFGASMVPYFSCWPGLLGSGNTASYLCPCSNLLPMIVNIWITEWYHPVGPHSNFHLAIIVTNWEDL